MLAQWLEELSQYDMVIQHHKGVHHGNADPLSCHPEDLKYCDCYEAGVTLESLPCGGVIFALIYIINGLDLKMMLFHWLSVEYP